MTRVATIEIHPHELTFSAGHFTIFSQTDREDLHGHNYSIGARFEVLIKENGMAFDYRFYKNKLMVICQEINLRFLLPAHSPYLTLEEKEDMWFAHFNKEKIPFLKRDVKILPLCNITIEELSHWFLKQLIQDSEELEKNSIQALTIKVFNGPSQAGCAHWKNSDLG